MKPIESFKWRKDEFTMTREMFKYWFRKEVEPINELIRNSVEVNVNCCNDEIYATTEDDIYTQETAFLINRKPIEADSAEKVLREMVYVFDGMNGVESIDVPKLVERAKKLLAKGEE